MGSCSPHYNTPSVHVPSIPFRVPKSSAQASAEDEADIYVSAIWYYARDVPRRNHVPALRDLLRPMGRTRSGGYKGVEGGHVSEEVRRTRSVRALSL